MGRQCTSCERTFGAAEPWYRFAVAIEGEQDLIDTTGEHAGDELKALITQLEQGPDDPTHWEEQVHWERSGVMCDTCRARLIDFLGGTTRAPH